MSEAPKDGTHFVARIVFKNEVGKTRYLIRQTWHGKASHVSLYGWCHGADPENINLWSPSEWTPYRYPQEPKPPTEGE